MPDPSIIAVVIEEDCKERRELEEVEKVVRLHLPEIAQENPQWLRCFAWGWVARDLQMRVEAYIEGAPKNDQT